MQGKSAYKVPEGKLVKIALDFNEGVITSIRITGDFFLYPEEALESIELDLIGKKVEKLDIISAVDATVKKKDIKFYGLNSEGIAEAIMLAKQSALGEKNE